MQSRSLLMTDGESRMSDWPDECRIGQRYRRSRMVPSVIRHAASVVEDFAILLVGLARRMSDWPEIPSIANGSIRHPTSGIRHPSWRTLQSSWEFQEDGRSGDFACRKTRNGVRSPAPGIRAWAGLHRCRPASRSFPDGRSVGGSPMKNRLKIHRGKLLRLVWACWCWPPVLWSVVLTVVPTDYSRVSIANGQRIERSARHAGAGRRRFSGRGLAGRPADRRSGQGRSTVADPGQSLHRREPAPTALRNDRAPAD